MRVLLVGGTFNDDGGKQSGVIIKMYASFIENGIPIKVYNGGFFSELKQIFSEISNFDAVCWFPDVPNDKEKIRDVKEVFPTKILVTSKRNDNNKYSYQELINRALKLKSNLFIEINKINDKYHFKLHDPLGNIFYDGNIINDLTIMMYNRLLFLASITRQESKKLGDRIDVPNNDKFFNLVKNNADIFHKLIHPEEGITRFLGNASFRCERGFPSFRSEDLIFVSQRNVDKRFIDQGGFVAVNLKHFKDTGDIGYYGDSKPSVDTPIQIRLFNLFPKINYILHSHVYAIDGVFTKKNVPCGAIEEVKEICEALNNKFETDHAILNLIGHGSLILSKDIDYIKKVKYYARNTPEIF